LLYNFGFFIRTVQASWTFIFKGKASHRVFVFQVLYTFVEALGITFLLALGSGGGVFALGFPFLDNFGQGNLIYQVLTTVIVRELGPLLVAIIVTARSATAIATELASLVISHETEAYISIGLNPIEHIASPRFLGVTFSVFLLNIYFMIFGLVCSLLTANFFFQISPALFLENFFANLRVGDIVISIVKSICFGIVISIISIITGFSVERSSTEIPVAGLRAVGACLVWCILIDIILSALYYVL
jgi:phospholipid/cholesterol/gamma-HCH transport system permease protein